MYLLYLLYVHLDDLISAYLANIPFRSNVQLCFEAGRKMLASHLKIACLFHRIQLLDKV